MKPKAAKLSNGNNRRTAVDLSAVKVFAAVCLCFLLLFSGCNQIQSPKPEPFIGEVAPPRRQEFRWSNGKMPKSFDPALAAAAPETDVVRAIYEGLTDLDSKNLAPLPAAAAKWSASEDFKTWTFTLRQNAKWSNGEPVTAQDFVKSWKRLTELGEKTAQRDLLRNIVGMDTQNVLPIFASEEIDRLTKPDEANSDSAARATAEPPNADSAPGKDISPKNSDSPKTVSPPVKSKIVAENNQQTNAKFGVEAVDKFTLKVTLVQPDKDFPSLVAHPIFRPVYDGDGKNFEARSAEIVTNGAFRIAEIEKDSLVLERSQNYWNRDAVQLERVRLVPTESAEKALAAYRAGDIDAITNADLEPLALKLLAPFEDFRRTKHSALNFYEFNLRQEPFNDRRIREALAIAIERERLTQGDMEGATEPALSFSPFQTADKLSQNAEKARKLLAAAGYENGADFPAIRLLVNRNNVQQRIARSIAQMWKKNLGIETEIIVKDQTDFENSAQIGDFDIIRRGIVLPTADETANMLNLFPADRQFAPTVSPNGATAKSQILTDESAESKLDFSQLENPSSPETAQSATANRENPENFTILTDADALRRLPAIPLYFPMSYALVKPYVEGFELNELDAISLKDVRIDSGWQPATAKSLADGKN